VSGKQAFLAAIVAASLGALAAGAATAQSAAINASLQTAEMKASVAKLGMAPKIASPRELAGLITAEFEKWTAVAKAANIKVD
jgi:tripartite-type tricarboxylate transporter receptor subunit TctC